MFGDVLDAVSSFNKVRVHGADLGFAALIFQNSIFCGKKL
jgi:hypothetical protein